MSAFEVSKAHIDALVTAAVDARAHGGGNLRWYFGNPLRSNEADCETAGRVGAMLWAENRRSVNSRYSEDEIEPVYEFERYRTKPLSIPQILKAIHCYQYQTCETDDWDTTEAHAFCLTLERQYVCQLPGYDEAEWEITS